MPQRKSKGSMRRKNDGLPCSRTSQPRPRATGRREGRKHDLSDWGSYSGPGEPSIDRSGCPATGKRDGRDRELGRSQNPGEPIRRSGVAHRTYSPTTDARAQKDDSRMTDPISPDDTAALSERLNPIAA